MYNIQDAKKLYQHSRIVNHLSRHFQSLELELEQTWDYTPTRLQQVVQALLDSTQGRVYVELRQDYKRTIFVAFEEPSDLTYVTLMLPLILSEKNT